MPIATQADHVFGDLRVRYLAPSDHPKAWGLTLWPDSKAEKLATPRELLDSPAILKLPPPWNKTKAWDVEPLVQAHFSGDALPAGYANGKTLRGSATTQKLAVHLHEQLLVEGKATLLATFVPIKGVTFQHEIREVAGGLEVRTSVQNAGEEAVTLDYLSAFTLGGITPFGTGDEPGRIKVHRFRSAWSAEGRHDVRSAEELNLERSWTGHGARTERFGSVGSLPVNGWFPTVALEDVRAGVTWLAQLVCPGTWQLEVSRRGDTFSLSGGGADRLDGEWRKILEPGESLAAPVAFLTAVAGGIDEACDRLVTWQRSRATAMPDAERELPVVFNEWCTSWGRPDHTSLSKLAQRLKGSGTRYLVIDDGWAERPGDAFQENGDWIVNRKSFPKGLPATAEAIRACGLVPGIWFEFEAVNPGSKAWDETAHQLKRDGFPLQVGSRRFWDFRDPWVHEYLQKRVIGPLQEGGFGYLKVDCNDSIGPGVDGPAAPGENLRQHLEGVQKFFRKLREEIPDLVIENCASGGHRLEPSMMALTAMSSFSDAHETTDLPIIAANLNRLVWSAQKQIWAVVRRDDSLQRLSYSLAATFLGRMCLSGDASELGDEAWKWVQQAIAFYRESAPLIRDGIFRCVRSGGSSYQHPTGEQAVIVTRADGKEALVVWHRFAGGREVMSAELPSGDWSLLGELSHATVSPKLEPTRVTWRTSGDWTGGVLRLGRSR